MKNHILIDSALQQKLLNHLAEYCGETGIWTRTFLTQKRIQLGCRPHTHGGAASWDVFNPRRIWLGSEYRDPALLSPNEFAEMLSLIVHEAVHVRQPFFKRLTVIGELEAWQTGFAIYHQLTGKYPNTLAERMMELPLAATRSNISQTRQLMKQFNRAYLAEWLLPWDWRYFRTYFSKK